MSRENGGASGEHPMRHGQCIWCGEVGLTESHIISKKLGGRIAPYLSCAACNSFLGTYIEEPQLKNSFISEARVATGLATLRDAYKKTTIAEPTTGLKGVFREDDSFEIISKPISEIQFRGTPEKAKEYWVKKMQRANPGLDTESLEQFFDSADSGKLSFHGKTFVKLPPQKTGPTVEIVAPRDLDPRFVFKSVYEFLHYSGLASCPDLFEQVRSSFNVSRDGSPQRIIFEDTLCHRILANTESLAKLRSKQEIDYAPYHYVLPRITPNQIVYIVMALFGEVKSVYMVGKCLSADDLLLLWLDKALVFPFRDRSEALELFPVLDYKKEIRSWDAAVDSAYSMAG